MKSFAEKAGSFAPSRLFSVAGLLSLVVTAVFLGLLFRELSVNAIVEFGEQNNIAMAQTALNSVKPELIRFVKERANIRHGEAFDSELPVELEASIRDTMHDTAVVRIKIYNQQGVVVFSTKRAQVGLDMGQNPGFQSAIGGLPKSRLVYGDAFNLWDEESEDDNLIQTYMPVREDPWTPVLGVFEIYTDVSGLVAKTERLQFLLIGGVILALALLYGFLLYIVRRGDRIISAQQGIILSRTKTLELLSAQMLTAEENERRRIAAKLHEGIAQTLSAVKLKLENSCAGAGDVSAEQKKHLFDSVVPEVRRAIQEVRAMAMEIHPPSLDDIGLLGTIHWACREFETIYPNVAVDTVFETTEQEIPSPLKIIIFRIVQEVLTHIGRQSKADSVHIRLQRSEGLIQLSIEDNGLAYYPAHASALAETGMASTRERSVLSGGSFTINSNRRGGTLYEAAWAA